MALHVAVRRAPSALRKENGEVVKATPRLRLFERTAGVVFASLEKFSDGARQRGGPSLPKLFTVDGLSVCPQLASQSTG